MALEYRPHGPYGLPIDPNRCKASIPEGGRSMSNHQCYRKPWQDGWCKQHHPDSEAERLKQQILKDKQRWERTPSAQLGRARDRIKVLEARIDKVLAMIRAERQPNPGSPWEVMDEFMRYFERKLQAILKGESNE